MRIAKMLSCFSKKFSGVLHVNVRQRVKNADHFLRFLKSLDWLRYLDMLDTCLGQEFYEQLPASAGSLLSLSTGEYQKKLQLSFDFIRDFSNLSKLSLRSNLSFKSLTSLMRSLDKFTEGFLEFKFEETPFTIRKRVFSEACEVLEDGKTLI